MWIPQSFRNQNNVLMETKHIGLAFQNYQVKIIFFIPNSQRNWRACLGALLDNGFSYADWHEWCDVIDSYHINFFRKKVCDELFIKYSIFNIKITVDWKNYENQASCSKTCQYYYFHMRCKTRGKKGEVALKIDISKAFDWISGITLSWPRWTFTRNELVGWNLV